MGAGCHPLSDWPRPLGTVSLQLGRCTLLPSSSPLRFNALFRQCAGFSLLRPRFVLHVGLGILDPMSIACPQRVLLRARLTLIRLALIRNPWSYGGRVSRPPYRYLYLHLLFRDLQRVSRLSFADYRNAPLPIALMAIPRLRHRTYARLLSMRDHSTSELLRTLQMNGCFQANILAV